MNVAVGVDAEDPDSGVGVAVAGDEGHPGSHGGGIGRVGERRPTVPVVVLGLQIGDELESAGHTVMVGSAERPALDGVGAASA